MNDKIILITGAANGIGKAAALALAKQDYSLIIHGRNSQAGLRRNKSGNRQ